MEAPKCRICGKREWGHDCPGGVPAAVVRPRTGSTPTAASTGFIEVATPKLGVYARVVLWRAANRERYNALQRAYMAKRRARGREA